MQKPTYLYSNFQGLSGLQAVGHLACYWLLQCGYGIEVWRQIGSAHVCGASNPGLLAAALDILSVLELTAEGRQVLADLLGQPFLEEPKSE